MPGNSDFFNIPLGNDFIIDNILMLKKMNGASEQIANTISELGWRNFEPPVPEVIRNLLRQSPGWVFDVGANSGFYSILSAATNVRVDVIAFEPYPSAKTLLERNISANRMDNRIRVSHLALSDKSGKGRLYIPTQEHGLVETSASLESSFKSKHSEVIDVDVATLDSVVSSLGGAIKQVSLIKIDVEGHEASVLRGAQQVINKYRPPVFIEVLPGADLPFLNRFLLNCGYKDIRFPSSCMSDAGDEVFFDPLSWNHLLLPVEQLGSGLW